MWSFEVSMHKVLRNNISSVLSQQMLFSFIVKFLILSFTFHLEMNDNLLWL